MSHQAVPMKAITTTTTAAVGGDDWSPDDLQIPINVRLDGCIVPNTTSGAARVSFSNVVVLDNLVDDKVRRQLAEFLVDDPSGSVATLPEGTWERKTADMEGAQPTWGLKPHILSQLTSTSRPLPSCIVEIQSRLAALYPEYTIYHLPSEYIQGQQMNDDAVEADCSSFLANAADASDSFIFHQDADPTSFPSHSAWVQTYGDYFNGEPRKPLLVTLLVYANDVWGRDWGGETLFLDASTQAGVFVQPKPCRAVLMHQDVVHRVSPPSASAPPGRKRLSFVWKLVFVRNSTSTASGGGDIDSICIARKEWGQPSSIGSAARVEAVMKQIAKQQQHRR